MHSNRPSFCRTSFGCPCSCSTLMRPDAAMYVPQDLSFNKQATTVRWVCANLAQDQDGLP